MKALTSPSRALQDLLTGDVQTQVDRTKKVKLLEPTVVQLTLDSTQDHLGFSVDNITF
jgi:hypothetical protein